MEHKMISLSYDYNALEPYIDSETMHFHYDKHYKTYTEKMNGVLAKYPQLTEAPEALMKKIKSLPMDEKDRLMFQNQGGGYINHSFFWTIMGPKKERDENLVGRIENKFGNVDEFKNQFSTLAANIFGSGWAWLVDNGKGELEMYSTPNQNSPYLNGHTPLITLDVWEHAYYLKYQNRRLKYIENWWNVLKLI